MSYMADRDHIAITSGDASTTTRKVSVPVCPVVPPMTVTYGESSDTYRRIVPDSGILSGHTWIVPSARRTQACPLSPLRHHDLWRRDGPTQRLGVFHPERRGRADDAAQAAHLGRSGSWDADAGS